MPLVWGLVLIPLSDDRKLISDQYHYLNEFMTHMTEKKMPTMENQNLLLSKYCTSDQPLEDYMTGKIAFCSYQKDPPRLNFKVYNKSIWTLLRRKSFFKRFNNLVAGSNNKILYDKIIENAQVELYAKDQVIFLRDRVGIVVQGSVEIRRHNNNNLMKPYIVKKAIEGDVIGWVDGDASNSSSPLSWLTSMQDNTEVVFINNHEWL